MHYVPYLELVEHDLNETILFFLLRYPSLVSLLQLFFVGLHHRQLTLRQLKPVSVDGRKLRNSSVKKSVLGRGKKPVRHKQVACR